jgi:4-alpha-glucanotransferase
MMTRGSGVLLHISSIPNKYGIGTFGKEAYDFVDFLQSAGQSYWQLLPMGQTGHGNSPYQSFSAFAGNPFFIDFELLVKDGLLKSSDFNNIDFGNKKNAIDYEKIIKNKIRVLNIAYKNSNGDQRSKVTEFSNDHHWVNNYVEFMAIKGLYGDVQWQDWPPELKKRDEKALEAMREELKDEIEFWKFIQYCFFRQWKKLKKYANKKDIKIIGDIPIYVSTDSVDTWVNSEFFKFDEEKMPKVVAGCPPDGFSKTGQYWGNPIYDWDLLEKRNFDWWIERIKSCMDLYDVIRIDHFRGFEAYWEIPATDDTAENGKWVKGPGIKIINAINENVNGVEIIAEDLGYLTKEVLDLRDRSGYPGMKILQLAFDTREDSDYLPHNYNVNCVVYTGTHDNDTIMGWLKNADARDVKKAKQYLNLTEEEGYNWGFIRGAWSSVGKLSIAPMQDFLGLNAGARMNIPSTMGDNWVWKLDSEQLTKKLSKKIYDITKLYGRLGDHI